jgi:hypothetical protein
MATKFGMVSQAHLAVELVGAGGGLQKKGRRGGSMSADRKAIIERINASFAENNLERASAGGNDRESH